MSSVALEPRRFRETSSRLSRIWTSRAVALLLLLALAVAVVAPGMMRGQLFPRPTPYVATMQYAAERLRAGELPLWNPHEHLGEPVARDRRAALWYPAMPLLLVLPQPQAWHAIAILHVWLAGCGAWLLAGRYGLEPVPRLMCGAAYALCGTTVLGLESAQANVLAWLPWAALAVERLSERVTAWRIVLAAAVLAVQFLGGDLLASGALLLTCTLALLIRAIWIGPRRWAAAIVACAFALAIALAASAVQWMPVVWPRQADPLGAISDLPRHWPWGAGPLLLGPTSPALFGAIPLALAATAIGFGRRPRAVVLWTIIASILAMAVIGFEVWARLDAEAVRSWPRPRVLVAGVCLAVAILAGFGIETVAALAAERAARLRAALIATSLALATISIVVALYFVRLNAGRLPGDLLLHCARLVVGAAMLCAAALVVRSHELPQWRSRGWPWVVLACAELLVFAVPSTRGVPVREMSDAGAVAAFLRSRAEPGRFVDAGTGLPEAFATWQSLEDAGGAGRGSARQEIWSSAVSAAGGRNGSDVLRVANVRYLVMPHGQPPPPPWRQVHRGGSLAIYQDAKPLTRAWVVPEGRLIASPSEALELLASTQPVNPRKVVLIEGASVAPVHGAASPEQPRISSGTVGESSAAEATYSASSPEEVRVSVPPGGQWLVVADAFAPGWHAWVNGRREPAVAAFGALRAVRMAGEGGEVTFRYQPPEWHYAVLTTAAGGGVMILLLAWSILRPRRPETGLARGVA